MKEDLLQCSVREDDPSVVDRVENEPPWEDWAREEEENRKAWRIEKECRLKDSLNSAFVAERHLQDPRYYRDHTDRHLCDLSKRIKSFERALCEQYRSEFGNDRLSVFLEHRETSTALPRNVRNPSRTDKRRMRKSERKRARQLEILTERGETSAQGQGITKTGALTTVVAAK